MKNKREISLQEVQQKSLNVLRHFHDFCQEHKLVYYLVGGTLLGAVRHNGFIPWDDDIDVAMPRFDYEKFLNLFQEKNQTPYLQLATHKIKSDFSVILSKLYDNRLTLQEDYLKTPYSLGPWIDIFPLDNMSDNYKTACLLFYKVRFWKWLSSCRIRETGRNQFKTMLRKLLGLFLRFVSDEVIQNRIDCLSRSFQVDKFTQYVCVVTMGTYGIKEIMPSSLFIKRELHSFEGEKFYVPSGYHQVLTNFYGDYMKLPPEERRKPHHNLIIVEEINK